jgi:hypothetical protein
MLKSTMPYPRPPKGKVLHICAFSQIKATGDEPGQGSLPKLLVCPIHIPDWGASGGSNGRERKENQMRNDASGADGDRTHDLVNAIHALSQLSYSPTG